MDSVPDTEAATIETLKALADESRLAIVRLIGGRELCVCEIAARLEMSDALVSHHLKKLRAAGIVRTRRSGQWLHCPLDPQALHALALELGRLATEVPVVAGSAPPAGACADRGVCENG